MKLCIIYGYGNAICLNENVKTSYFKQNLKYKNQCQVKIKRQ